MVPRLVRFQSTTIDSVPASAGAMMVPRLRKVPRGTANSSSTQLVLKRKEVVLIGLHFQNRVTSHTEGSGVNELPVDGERVGSVTGRQENCPGVVELRQRLKPGQRLR